MPLKTWLLAIRPKTLPLAVASIVLGAASAGTVVPGILVLALLTALLLQIVSNLANDYGDGVRGTDGAERIGPVRVLASGQVSPLQLRRAMIQVTAASLASGLALLALALGCDVSAWLGFLLLGALSVLAALGYTLGRRPYGYLGLGDAAVFVFFGLVAVLGTGWLMRPELTATGGWAALVAGLLSMAVLNINNIRDMAGDRAAGKRTLALRLGLHRARAWQGAVLALAVLAAERLMTGWGYVALAGLWPLAQGFRLVLTREGAELNRALALTARGTLILTTGLALGLAAA
ncbi:1,4-dihydroxy-2-naphthoate octaprenyltransferase [Oceanimonas baumannii]|uniref:1,4-dihydroxy-2-naphthoate octaprenyltransferase n=1 Tax=Oceanimonas baumannii TaxID=129578 RepID=A0A235CGE1_9GAMM|nr:1,4-dihydroxy-2-naphthoate octaprenyltransferase [Oceanimonas baumannii]OYD23678.1 1,4-dihydroxy-2-naphthoate octaprenyltransferase [Oceanimonas baumannii]TDW55875.1 1,4-dihydroxy-2-naphthoate prenyltransferase [Oceanimonas baumannii]